MLAYNPVLNDLGQGEIYLRFSPGRLGGGAEWKNGEALDTGCAEA